MIVLILSWNHFHLFAHTNALILNSVAGVKQIYFIHSIANRAFSLSGALILANRIPFTLGGTGTRRPGSICRNIPCTEYLTKLDSFQMISLEFTSHRLFSLGVLLVGLELFRALAAN